MLHEPFEISHAADGGLTRWICAIVAAGEALYDGIGFRMQEEGNRISILAR